MTNDTFFRPRARPEDFVWVRKRITITVFKYLKARNSTLRALFQDQRLENWCKPKCVLKASYWARILLTMTFGHPSHVTVGPM